MKEKIGFIGLGEMGFGMAVNLVKSGYEIFGFDVKQDVCKEAARKGISICTSIRDVAKSSDNAVISIVRNYKQTEEVIFGKEGIISSGNKGLTVIVMSTLDPDDMIRLAEETEEEGFNIVDAPIRGAKARADEGTLAIMTAGKREIVCQCRPYFEIMGKNIFYFGNVGSAQAAKLANNLMLAINMIGCCEGMKFGESFNLPLDELLELLKVGSGNSWVVQNWNVVSKWWENYKPNETLDIVHKDLLTIGNVCFKKKLSLPMSGVASARIFNAWDKD